MEGNFVYTPNNKKVKEYLGMEVDKIIGNYKTTSDNNFVLEVNNFGIEVRARGEKKNDTYFYTIETPSQIKIWKTKYKYVVSRMFTRIFNLEINTRIRKGI